MRWTRVKRASTQKFDGTETREEESKQRQEDDNFSFLLPHFADGFMGMFSEK